MFYSLLYVAVLVFVQVCSMRKIDDLSPWMHFYFTEYIYRHNNNRMRPWISRSFIRNRYSLLIQINISITIITVKHISACRKNIFFFYFLLFCYISLFHILYIFCSFFYINSLFNFHLYCSMHSLPSTNRIVSDWPKTLHCRHTRVSNDVVN